MSIAWFQFLTGALLVIIAGTKLTKSAEILGEKWKLGSGWAGVLLLPLATSLPELTTSLRAILIQAPDLAAGNLFGSNLFNITIIAMIDFLQGKRSIFFHASKGHALAAFFGIFLMCISGIGIFFPLPTFWKSWIGLDTALLICGYLLAAGLLTGYEKRNSRLENHNIDLNMERKLLPKTQKKNHKITASSKHAFAHFVFASTVILFAGVALTDAADIIALKTGLGRTFIGSIALAVATSLPEVATTTTAARLGKPDMAIGNIMGANVYNMFILAIMDIFYLKGSLLQAISLQHLFTIGSAIMLSFIVMIGFIYRSKTSIGWISLPSFLIVIGYLAAFTVLYYNKIV